MTVLKHSFIDHCSSFLMLQISGVYIKILGKSAKVHTTTLNCIVGVFRSRFLTAGFQGNLRNVIVRKRHNGFDEFIFFAILVTILNLMKNEKRNELTLMNGENDANSMRANQK